MFTLVFALLRLDLKQKESVKDQHFPDIQGHLCLLFAALSGIKAALPTNVRNAQTSDSFSFHVESLSPFLSHYHRVKM